MNDRLRSLKWYKKLFQKKNRVEEGFFLCEGGRAVNHIIQYASAQVDEILCTTKWASLYKEYRVRVLDDKQFSDITGLKTPSGVLAVLRLPTDVYSMELPDSAGDNVLFLEGVQDPGNVGTLIRTAAAFGFSGIIMSDKCADPFSFKVVQSTAGSIFSLWIRRTNDYIACLSNLMQQKYVLITTDLKGESDVSFLTDATKRILCLGNEAAGLSKTIQEKADYRLKIPIRHSGAESLNVASAGAVCMYLMRS